MGADKATGLYDVKRLAAHLGVQPSTIRSMKARGTIPLPTSDDINGGAVWSSEIIEDYLRPTHSNFKIEKNKDLRLPKIIDLFAGCGGMSLGFRLSGFDVVAGFDNWERAVETYNANLDHSSHLIDLSNIDETINALSPYYLNSKPAIIGGPPCQDFSSAGKRQEGTRANLTEQFAKIVAHFMPPFFVIENVARTSKSAAFQKAMKILTDAGYEVDTTILNAACCGVPQRRKRLIAFGSLDTNFTATVLKALNDGLSKKETTVRDWFGLRLDTEYYYRHPRSYARRGIFSIDEPSPTIRGVNRPIPDGYPGHPGDACSIEQARPLSAKERAEIQTFPKEFRFVGSKTDIEQMIGNAVPVQLAKYVADHISTIFLLNHYDSQGVES